VSRGYNTKVAAGLTYIRYQRVRIQTRLTLSENTYLFPTPITKNNNTHGTPRYKNTWPSAPVKPVPYPGSHVVNTADGERWEGESASQILATVAFTAQTRYLLR
jgi:hypothetical protein